MSIYRMWYLKKEFKKIDEWLIAEENNLPEYEANKKLELYDKAFYKADTVFMSKMTSLWVIACVYIKYFIVFILLASLIDEFTRHSELAFLFSFIVVIVYRKLDMFQIFNRYRDMQLQYLSVKTRLLQEAINIEKSKKG
ncbi:hypothetical protein [Campylobacter fetus]|uniref:hypothetical protein n=1 Tax=Campylobacter fetus TaxID=196 RepID=UPI000818C295|nr:hypothetical protein [Campylobacter fetus]OCR85282.1 hypothetical protein CFT12S05168_05385 [Campylobacter fetus subsp. testudinum]OCR92642.1 hypothetical protein CFT12S02263_05040 [Campylobacter fetus subsp. testudinum]